MLDHPIHLAKSRLERGLPRILPNCIWVRWSIDNADSEKVSAWLLRGSRPRVRSSIALNSTDKAHSKSQRSNKGKNAMLAVCRVFRANGARDSESPERQCLRCTSAAAAVNINIQPYPLLCDISSESPNSQLPGLALPTVPAPRLASVVTKSLTGCAPSDFAILAQRWLVDNG